MTSMISACGSPSPQTINPPTPQPSDTPLPQPSNPPELGWISDQVVPAGEPFPALTLSEYLENYAEPARIEWTLSGQETIAVTITDGMAQVQAPAGWTGEEILQFSACDPWGRCDDEDVRFIRFDDDDLLIGFFGIDGFLIAHQGMRILIDVLIEEALISDPMITETLLGTEPPMDRFDLMLVTHDHGDHFEPNSVLQFLRNHPETQILSTSEVVARLLALLEEDDLLREQILSAEVREGGEAQMVVNQVPLTVFDLPHPGSQAPENLGYMLRLGDLLLLHTGDLDFIFSSIDKYPFGGYAVDYAFLPTVMINFQTHERIRDWLGGGTLIPMHYRSTGPYAASAANDLQEIREWFPGGVYFARELHYWLGP
jgi:L-ascorbate metabolism protein UlaG (beta-lactamase superfamily)